MLRVLITFQTLLLLTRRFQKITRPFFVGDLSASGKFHFTEDDDLPWRASGPEARSPSGGPSIPIYFTPLEAAFLWRAELPRRPLHSHPPHTPWRTSGPEARSPSRGPSIPTHLTPLGEPPARRPGPRAGDPPFQFSKNSPHYLSCQAKQ
jgi:hypothetical protein